jgi:hypothetical protein
MVTDAEFRWKINPDKSSEGQTIAWVVRELQQEEKLQVF